jgi:HD-GYP domain-containing protein (c-di-GMP phosphodiesterase class II)
MVQNGNPASWQAKPADMHRPLSALWSLVLAQALCLAVGLWIHDGFVISSLEHQIVDAPSQPSTSGGTGSAISHVQGVLPVTRWIALVWIGGLQTALAYLILSRAFTQSSETQTRSAELTLQRENDLLRTRNAVIFGLAKLAESRDPDTGYHLEKIACYSTRLAQALRRSPRYRSQVTPAFVRQIGISSALHDIGKVGVEDAVLLKPGQLTAEERERMQMHAIAGGECIREIERRLGNSNFLQLAREIAFCHHERWDGEGYPAGLSGEQIPLAARIVAIADVYDALSSRRVYKEAFSHEKCLEIIREESGKQFDPDIVDIFLKIEKEFREIAEWFASESEHLEVLSLMRLKTPEEVGKLTPSQEEFLKKLLETEGDPFEIARTM